MKIRKLYRFEACHIVRGCNSERCKKSFHGHSYVVEVFLEADDLTSYGMVMDFGDLKTVGIAQLFDNLDHAFHFSAEDECDHIKDFIKKNNQRWVELPVNPTAENYAALFCREINKLIGLHSDILDNKFVRCCAVRVHETATGYAEATMDDVKLVGLEPIMFSRGIINKES